jgi:glutaminyl-peptide cyclotransferase
MSPRLVLAVLAGNALLLAGVVIAVALASGGGGDASDAGRVTAGVPRPTVDRFDERRAFALLREQVDRYGHRPAGSGASRRLGERLRGLLPNGRFEPVPGGLRNVVGVLPGTRPAVVIGAHYDTEALPLDFVGANDGAAGTAAVVELARALAGRPRGGPELRFVLFDGEEERAGTDFFVTGTRGSRAYARRHAREVRELVLLDYVANRGVRFPREAGSTPALWARLRAAARRVGGASAFPPATRGEIFDDHSAFTRAGVPAVDLIDFSYRWRDTARDTVDKTSAASLDVAGEAVAELLWRERG